MADFILPTEKAKPTRVNPAISIFYGPPKIGKTTKLGELDGCLILDAEKGTEAIDAMRVPINSISGATINNPDGTLAFTSVDAVYEKIAAIGMAYFKEHGTKPPPPYKYIAVDTIDKLEDFCEVTATAKYKASAIGKNFEGKSVIELPNGAGYYHLRNEVMLQIERLSGICKNLILISHIRDKNLNKGGVDVSVRDISLTGRLGQMVCAKADIVGFVYRDAQDPSKLMVSFETLEDTTMGSRFPRLAGKRIPFDWNEIFLPETK